MELKETIFALSELNGVSGNENAVSEYAAGLLREYTDNVTVTNGGVIAEMGSTDENAVRVVLDAHSDSIGFVVTSAENGFAKVSNVGGLDMRILSAQRVTVHGKEPVKGVICSVPPHLKSGKKEVPDISEIYIDVGKGGELISEGDAVSFDVKPAELLNGRITGGSLDDRCGMAAILYALSLIDVKSLRCRLAVVFSSQEEIGARGAVMCAYRADADIAIAVDVSFAYAEGEKRSDCGEMGKGCMIGYSPVLDRELSRKMTEIAKRENIPYQTEVMSKGTGTNADSYAVSRGGAKAVTLSIPLKYMHTPAEVIDPEDVISTGRLIAAYLKEVGV